MDLALPGDEHPARVAVRSWLAAHPDPSPRQLAESGYVAPHWPRPWGLGADAVDQLVIDEELRRAGVRRPFNQIGIGWAGPTLIHAGTDAQQARYLLPLLAGEEVWCQLFSEPGAGSDLAGLSTRAERDGDEWVVRGQKVWTSFAHIAALGILLARTDADAPKHRGISYFICPMDAPGVSVRPILDMTGDHAFNEVFLDDVRLSTDHLVGAENEGWALAKVTLGNERVSLSGEGSLWGQGPTAADLVDLVRRSGGVRDLRLRQDLARVWSEGEVLRLIRLRTVSAAMSGRAPGPEASVRKALADEHGQRVMEMAVRLAGTRALLAGAGPTDPGVDDAFSWPEEVWAKGYLFSRALTIGGGTAEVQRNIVAERVLGLPHDPDVEQGRSWAETRSLPDGAAV
ncbi:MAG TPA: acyl-CoA dehydrogenase [Acidimicrobiaceae bacterium]|nr:acyl-CoA dehydrogenase [Acidimicrobiaceae bacterium]